MNTRPFFLGCILVSILTLLPLSAASGQEPGMEPQLPGNPLTRMMSGLNPANWKMPQLKMPSMNRLLPTNDEKERVITKKNSFVDEVSTTAKNSWQRTKQTLNPMRLIPAGFRQNAQTAPAPAPQPKQERGFFSRLFAPFPPQEDASSTPTVTDFLKQEPVR